MFIRVIDENESLDITAELGFDLMTLLRQQKKPISSPCGGRGTCGKCLVEVDGLGPVLACQTVIGRDLPVSGAVVRLPRKSQALILIDGLVRDRVLQPLVQHFDAVIPPPTLKNQQADDERFYSETGFSVPFALLGELPVHLAAANGKVSFWGRHDTKTVMRFLPVEATSNKRVLGVAIDIGTTTLAAYLYDLQSGERLASAARTNPQTAYGADVISRISRAVASDSDRLELKRLILEAITSLIQTLYSKAAKEQEENLASDELDLASTSSDMVPNDLALLTCAGNTTMMHLLLGISAENISRAPFNPVTVKTTIVTAPELELELFPQALVVLMPSVASYVGADITAGVIALGLEKPGQETALLIDIGTNGEIVLRTRDHLTACATAAGPAFEGANITNGMSGTSGAIDHVWITDGDLSYSVISNGDDSLKPAGICGSGLIDLVAAMLASGVIDETGRIGADPEILPPALLERLTEINGQPAFLVASALETETRADIYLTQKDIRELQNAKAALAAGIQLLLRREGTAAGDVKLIYLAGGFGQYLNVLNAKAIGLLPAELTGRVIAAGNTSAMGAIAALLDISRLEAATVAAAEINYLELSSDPEFSDLFIEALMFPVKD